MFTFLHKISKLPLGLIMMMPLTTLKLDSDKVMATSLLLSRFCKIFCNYDAISISQISLTINDQLSAQGLIKGLRQICAKSWGKLSYKHSVSNKCLSLFKHQVKTQS